MHGLFSPTSTMILSTSRRGIVPALVGNRGSMRILATAASASRAARKEGSIADIFTSLTDESHVALPDRFVEVKRALWNDGLVESWKQVLEALEPAVENIVAKGSDVWSLSFVIESNVDYFAIL